MLAPSLHPPSACAASSRVSHVPARLRVLGLFALLAFALGSTGCRERAASIGGTRTKEGLIRVRFQTDFYAQAEHGGFYQAVAKGYYREAGLEVEVVPGGPGATVGQRLLGAQAELAMSMSDGIVLNVSDDVPFLIVGAFMQHDPLALLVHDSDPVKDFADLAGRPVMTTPGSIWIAQLRERYGVEFPVVPMNYGIAQFLANPRFIQQCFITSEPYFVETQGVKARTLLISDSGYDPYRVIITTRQFAREHPEATRAFVAATLRGWHDFLHGDPEPAKRLILAANRQMTPEMIDYSIAALKRFKLVDGDPAKGERLGLLTRKRLQTQIDQLARLKITPGPVPLEKVVSFDFLPPELKALVDAP